MTGELRMADSIFTANLPPGFDAYLGYAGGTWPTFAVLEHLFPDAWLLSMAISAGEDAEGADCENGDMTVAQVPSWVQRQHARGVPRPVCYASASSMGALSAALQSAGIARPAVRLLCAHYTYTPHICGPATCAFPGVPACDGTQWTDRAPGLRGSLIDESLLAADFFGTPAPPAPEEDMPSGSFQATTAPQYPSWLAGTAKGITVFAPASSFTLAVHHSADGGSWYEVPGTYEVSTDEASASYDFGSPTDINGARVTFASGAAGATWHTF